MCLVAFSKREAPLLPEGHAERPAENRNQKPRLSGMRRAAGLLQSSLFLIPVFGEKPDADAEETQNGKETGNQEKYGKSRHSFHRSKSGGLKQAETGKDSAEEDHESRKNLEESTGLMIPIHKNSFHAAWNAGGSPPSGGSCGAGRGNRIHTAEGKFPAAGGTVWSIRSRSGNLGIERVTKR